MIANFLNFLLEIDHWLKKSFEKSGRNDNRHFYCSLFSVQFFKFSSGNVHKLAKWLALFSNTLILTTVQ